MSNLLFKKGLVNNLKALEAQGKVQSGTVYFTTDEGGMYIGVDSSTAKRVQGSVIYYDNANQFLAETKPPYSDDVLYFIANGSFKDGERPESWNALIRWDSTKEKFVQINTTAEDLDNVASQVKSHELAISFLQDKLGLAGEGDSKTLTVIDTLTKDISDVKATLDTLADAEGLATLAGRVQDNETAIIELKDKDKALDKKDEEHTNAIAAINTTLGNMGDTIVANRLTALENNKADKSTVEDLQTGLDNANASILEITGTTIPNLSTSINNTISNLDNTVSANKAAYDKFIAEDYAETAALAEANKGRLDGHDDTLLQHGESISNLTEQVKNFAASSDFAELKGRVDKAETDIGTNAANIALKADASALQATDLKVGQIEAEVAKKANAEDVNNSLDAINGELTTIKDNIGDNADAIEGLVETVKGIATNADEILGLKSRVKNNEDDIADINAVLPTLADKQSVTNLSDLIGDIEDGKTVVGLITDNANKISNNTDAILAITEDYLTSEDYNELLSKISDNIQAANAMVYKGGISSEADITAVKNSGVSIGDTYIVTAGFGEYYSGDLIVFSSKTGKEDAATGFIASENIEVIRVDTGYIQEHESTMDVETVDAAEGTNGEVIPAYAKLRLNSHVALTEDKKGDLGKIAIKGGENVTITSSYDSAKSEYIIEVGMAWGEF